MKYSQKQVAKMFDDLARSDYESTSTKITRLIKQTAFKSLKLSKDDVLLDAGTGTGKWAVKAAKLCKLVIGIDISKKSLKQAQANARKGKLNNVKFYYGSFENPSEIISSQKYRINKILILYSFHHLTDDLKKKSIPKIIKLLHRPARVVIGDMMFFENPKKHQDKFDEINYDGGETDFPAKAEFLVKCFKKYSSNIQVKKIHPLAGVIVIDIK